MTRKSRTSDETRESGRKRPFSPLSGSGPKRAVSSPAGRSWPRAGKRNGPPAESGRRPPTGKTGERIAKTIARAGLGSRREAETWIAAGRVAINGTVIASPAVNVTAHDKIMVDGKPLPARERTRLFLFHKPRGLVTTSADPEGRPTIFGALPKDLPRLISVGRLDLNTEGLLLLTNDGGLARVLELPETGWLRRYRVRAHGKVTQQSLDGLRDGIEVDGVRYGPIEATLDREQGSNNWLTFAMREGKNREIRNVLGALELQVNRLIRVSFGPFQLGELRDGGVEEVKTRTLRDQIGERLAALAGADFTAPLIAREAPAPPRAKPERPKPSPQSPRERSRTERPDHRGAVSRQDRKPKREPRHRTDERPTAPRSGHVWRDHAKSGDAPRQDRKPQREPRPRTEERSAATRSGHVWRDHAKSVDTPRPRKYPGPRAGTAAAQAAKRPGLIADRKGRRVVVERAAEKPPRPGRRPRGGKWHD